MTRTPWLFGKFLQIIADGFDISGAMGNGTELFKAGKHAFRLQARQFSHFIDEHLVLQISFHRNSYRNLMKTFLFS